MIDRQWARWVAQTVHPYSNRDAERAELARRMCGSRHYVTAKGLFPRGASGKAVRELLKRALLDVLHEERFALAGCPIPPEPSTA
jgi:hypothetical protein